MRREQASRTVRWWLRDTGSLTRRLQRLSEGTLQVQVLVQRWERPQRREASILGVPPQHYALIREVVLLGRGQPWVYARSVLPLRVLRGELGFLRHWGNRPLGALLFGNRAIARGPIVLIQWPSRQLPVALRHLGDVSLPGRYSVFRHRDGGILVTEVVLPALGDSVMLGS